MCSGSNTFICKRIPDNASASSLNSLIDVIIHCSLMKQIIGPTVISAGWVII